MNNPVITGMGVISAIGLNPEDFWQNLLRGTRVVTVAPWPAAETGSRARPLWYSPVPPQFRATDWAIPAKMVKNSARFAQYALAAVRQAVAQAGLSSLPALRTAVIVGTSMGGVPELLQAGQEGETASAVPARLMATVIPNMASAQIAMLYGLHGPQLTLSTACASALDAIGLAARLIQSGAVDIAVAGGAEHLLDPVVGYSLSNAHALSQAESAEEASRPFDVRRNGFVMGEGAAMIVLESPEHARQRQANPWGCLRGYATVADGYHVTSPDPSGTWEALAMTQALADAQCGPDTVDAVIAHGTSTVVGDQAEIRALNQVFASRPVPVTSMKGHCGHAMGTSGALSVVAALHAMRDGMLPPTLGTEQVDPAAAFDLITHGPRRVELATVQVNAFGFGGQNASLILGQSPA